MARLKILKSQKPRPSTFLEQQSLLQASQCRDLEFPLELHQKFAIIELISSSNMSRRLKYDIAYAGIDCATALMRISLPPLDKVFSLQQLISRQILSLIEANTSCLDLPRMEGRLKDLSCQSTSCIPRISQMSLLASMLVLWLKVIADFSILIRWPEAFS